MSPLPTLLGIPFELRAMIILLVALTPQSDPPDPANLHGQRRRTSETDLLPLGPVVAGQYSRHGRRDELTDFFRLDKNMDGSLKARCLDNPGMETAARLMCFVWEELQFLTRPSEHNLGLSKRLHENIGVIKVHLVGKTYKTWTWGIALHTRRAGLQRRRAGTKVPGRGQAATNGALLSDHGSSRWRREDESWACRRRSDGCTF